MADTRIFCASPFRADRDLGRAYNEFMELLKPDDWACLLDHDAMFTTRRWHEFMTQAIADNPQAGVFVARTNRIGACGWQKAPGSSPKNFDMLFHRRLGLQLEKEHGAAVRDVTVWEDQPSHKPMTGVCMLISKRAWEKVNGFRTKRFLTVDNDMHRRVREAGMRVYLLLGVYCFHYYRAGLPRKKK